MARQWRAGNMRAIPAAPPVLDFRLLFNSVPGLYLVLSPGLRIVAASDACLRATTTERDAIVGRGLFEVFPDGPGEPDRAGAGNRRASLARVLRTRAADAMNAPVLDANGEVAFIIHCVQAPDERYRTLFENTQDGIVIADRESYYIDANPSICAMLGYSRDELIGLHASDIVAAAEIPHIGSALRTITSAAEYHREWRFRRKDGSAFQAEVIATVMPDGNLLGMIRDVTARRTLEEQYQQAQKMEAIGRLAGGVAHDFNNLLTVILGYCGLLVTDSKPGDPGLAAIVEIQQAGARASELTRQLLAFSRKEIIEPTLLDLNLVTADLQVMLGRLIGEDVKVVCRPAPAEALVKADRGQVEQIVMNLAINARDAMPRGGTLTIETANVEIGEHDATTHAGVTPGPYVMLTVTDTGTGMTPEVQARLFEPFFTTKEAGKGTGLGLATVNGIVTRSGGSVSVRTELGKGTAFQVYFPRADAGEAETVVPTAAPVVRPVSGTHTVLVVEDEEGVRVLAGKLLERQGYTVLLAASVAEALRIFEANRAIDLVLTDVVMPGASGLELARQLLERQPAPKVIYMSGYTEEAIGKYGFLEPGIAFLNKPFTSQTLVQKIRDVLGR
jgi:two-component system, cell cycle sensor histidine kinase and response regulator CckA